MNLTNWHHHLVDSRHREAGQDLLRAMALAAGILWSGVALALDAPSVPQPITVHYVLRPPYMSLSANGLTGLTGAPTVLAFMHANIPFVLADTPFARQLHMIEVNSGQDCMIGMFKTPEREVFAKFTHPIYRDSPQIILTAAANAPRFSKFSSVVDLLSDKTMELLVKLRYSYGKVPDALIERYQPTLQKTTDENLLMLKAIKLKMSDYMFMTPEEASVAIAAAGFSESDFRQIKFKNMPDGDYRHIMCSKNVPDHVIAKLNAAITFK